MAIINITLEIITFLVAWVLVSIPVGFLVGRFINRGMN